MKSEAAEAAELVVAAAASKTTYAGSGAIMFGWLFSNEAAVFIGILVGLLGFAVNWYYKHKADRRAQQSHDAFLKKLGRSDVTHSDLGELGGEG